MAAQCQPVDAMGDVNFLAWPLRPLVALGHVRDVLPGMRFHAIVVEAV